MNTVAWMLASTDHGPLIINRVDYNEGFQGKVYGVGAQLMEKGNYDPGEVDLTKELLSHKRHYKGDGVFALDGGANIGVHAVEWARHMRGWGSVLAVEAQERVFYALAGNLALQNCTNARAVWGALTDQSTDSISIPEPDYEVPSSFGSFELRRNLGTENIGQPVDYDRPTLSVQPIKIDNLALGRLDLLKLDIEGMEAEAIRGALDTIYTCRPVILAEIIKADQAEIIAMLEDYRTFPMGPNILGIHKDDPILETVVELKKVAA